MYFHGKGAKIYPNSKECNWNVNKIFFYQILIQLFYSTPVDSLPGFVFWVKLVQEEALLT